MRERKKRTVCGADVMDAICHAYPDNIVTDDVAFEEGSYYEAICDEVQTALRRIKQADLSYDRPPEGRPHWDEGGDPDEDPPAWVEEPSSYDLFFLALRGQQFEFQSELEEEDFPEDADEPVLVVVPTVGRIGCAVGISVIAPFAVIRFTEMEIPESGSGTIPDIWPHMFDLDGTELDVEAHYEGLFLEEGITALRYLREAITRILDEFSIRVLSEQELNMPIPELRLEPARNVVPGKKSATVEDALFFQTI